MDKKCFKCGETKDIDMFYRHNMMADKHLGKCKECTKKDTRNDYLKDPDKHREYETKRAVNQHRKEKMREYARQRRAKNPEKHKAHNMVRNHVKSGKLIVEPCRDCGATQNIQAHHEDYSKPLEIIWLCFNCHRIVHGQSTLTQNPSTSNKIRGFVAQPLLR